MALKLPDSAVPMGDFPVAKAVDIDFDDGENLQEKLDNGTLGGGGNTTDLTEINNKLSKLEAKRVYNSLEELNTVKGLSISFIDGEDNTMKIIDALSPVETFADYFNNSINTNRFGIDTNTYGTDISLLTITKFNDKITIIRAFMVTGKLLLRRYLNGVLEDWRYDKTDLTDLENRVSTNETNITGLQEQIDNLDIPEDVDLTEINDKLSKLETKRVYNSVKELNTAKGLSISFTNGEDNTMKIVDALSPIETFTDYFKNDINNNRFGIDVNTYGNDMLLLSITKFNDEVVIIRAFMVNGKLLVRHCLNGALDDWRYDSTDLTVINTKMAQLETQVDDLFQSVSDGKTLVANAITDKGVSTSTTATFATMATNVGKITNYTASDKQALATAITNKGVSTSSTDSFSTMASNVGKITTSTYKEETKSYNNTSSGANRLVFTFSADVSGVKQITPPSDNISSHIVPETLTDMFTVDGKKLTLYVNGNGTWTVTALIES